MKQAGIIVSVLLSLCAPALLRAAENGTVYISADSLQSEKAFEEFRHFRYYLGIKAWKYHPGDDPAWAEPGFDDSSWEIVDTRLMPGEMPETGWERIGWFRLRLCIEPAVLNIPVALQHCQVGAAEIYLDGRLVHTLGRVADTREDEISHFVMRPVPLPISFGDGKEHLLAVRYSNSRSEFLRRHKYPLGFWMLLGDRQASEKRYQDQIRHLSSYQMFFTGMTLTFTLLHFLLFVFYPRERANLYYAAFTGSNAILTYFIFSRMFTADLHLFLVHTWFFKVSILILLLTGSRFLYAIFYPGIPRQFWFLLAAVTGLTLGGWYVGEHVVFIFALLVIAEMLRTVIAAVLKKKEGARIIGIGFLVFGLASAYQMLSGIGVFEERGGIFEYSYLFGILGLLLPMSIYLARNFALTNRGLEAQLLMVSELSVNLEAANVELEEHSRTLEQKVQERTSEVRAKNTELERTLTELKETQTQLVQSEKMASLGNLVAGVVHELNTPLGAIRSMQNSMVRAVEKLKLAMKKTIRREDDGGEKIQSVLRVIDDANQVLSKGTERVVGIVGSLRSFACLDEAEYQVADLHEGIESTLTLMQGQLEEDIEVTREYGELEPVYCAPAQLNQVFMRLLKRAIQSIDGRGEIRITTSQDAEKVYVEVADTGKGIPEEELKRIFDFGFSSTGSRVKMEMGLSVDYNIIQAHQGEIRVESEEGKGTKVTITLPRKRTDLG